MAWFVVFLLSTVALADEGPECLDRAVGLLRYDVNGFRVYKELNDRRQFGFWLDCDDRNLDLSSAVHESVHLLSGGPSMGSYRFYLVGGNRVEVPQGDTPARSVVKAGLKANERDSYVQTYLSGVSGEQGFEVLLDELNAYAHGLGTEVGLQKARPAKAGQRTGARDGVAHFQLYTLLYLKALREAEPALHERLAGTHGELVGLLWKQAEAALDASLDHPALGMDDRWYLYRAYESGLLAELDRFCGARVWSSTLEARVRANPPAGPSPPDMKTARATSKQAQQQRIRATVILGELKVDFEEGWPSGEVVLTVNGERAAAATWADVQALGLPDEVIRALEESRKALRK